MGQAMFEVFHQAIIDAHDGEKTKPESESETSSENQPHLDLSPEQQPEECATMPVETENDEPQSDAPTHQGKLVLDATVVEQAIRYPTDLGLLNEAREFSEQVIDALLPSQPRKKETENLPRDSTKSFSSRS